MAKDWEREAHSLSPPFILLQFLSRAIVSVFSFARRDQLQANRLKKAFLWSLRRGQSKSSVRFLSRFRVIIPAATRSTLWKLSTKTGARVNWRGKSAQSSKREGVWSRNVTRNCFWDGYWGRAFGYWPIFSLSW